MKKRKVNFFRIFLVLACLVGTVAVINLLLSNIGGTLPQKHQVVVLDAAFGGGYTGNEGYITEAEYARQAVEAIASEAGHASGL